MPFRPDFSAHEPDARFEPFHDRVARLFRDDEEVGLVLVRIEPFAQQVSGRLWWSRWPRSRDVLWLWTIVDGQFEDMLVPSDRAEQELEDWTVGRFEYFGRLLRAEWLGSDESQRLARSEFG